MLRILMTLLFLGSLVMSLALPPSQLQDQDQEGGISSQQLFDDFSENQNFLTRVDLYDKQDRRVFGAIVISLILIVFCCLGLQQILEISKWCKMHLPPPHRDPKEMINPFRE